LLCIFSLSLSLSLACAVKVFEAAQQGFKSATGIEINRVLVYYARMKSFASGQGEICRFKRENLWKVMTKNSLSLVQLFFNY
jgi:hypothetical protein